MQLSKIKRWALPALFGCLMAGSGGSALSQRHGAVVQHAPPAVKISLSGAIERKDGNVAIEKAGSVNPGEVINYTIISNNEGSGSARDYKTIGPIPARTIYVDGSAKAEGASVVYSIDGG